MSATFLPSSWPAPIPAPRHRGDGAQAAPGWGRLRFGREVALSSGAACAGDETSPVLQAIGRDEALARGSLRFGLGRFSTEAEIDFAAEAVAAQVARLKGAWT